MLAKVSKENSHHILVFLSYAVVFVIGLYVSRGIHRYQLISRVGHSSANPVDSPTFYNASVEKQGSRVSDVSANAVDPPKFYNVSLLYKTDKVTAHHYELLYEKYLHKYIATDVSILEIGLGCDTPYGPGPSAYVWRMYLGPRADIHLVEYDRSCAENWYKEHGQKLNITMHYGDQSDVVFLKGINTTRGYFDVIIDDGGHKMNQQITSLYELLPKVRSGGIYVIEDIHTSYVDSYGGGYRRNTTTIELIKRLVDDIQTESPHKSTTLAASLLSFEISNEICVFNVK